MSLKSWSEWVGADYSLYVSSGSTANFLLLASVKEYYGLKDGDKVLVPADTWVTNIGPVIQLGLTPIFVILTPQTLVFVKKIWGILLSNIQTLS